MPAGGGQTTDRDPASIPRVDVESGLWLVATPIGNLDDVSQRALTVLAAVDRVACEDTRRTTRLLARHRIAARLVSYHEHNAARVRPALLRTLEGGGSIALVSDAGTPLISDPGYKLVRAVLDAGIRVTGCPGPSAPLLALILFRLAHRPFLLRRLPAAPAGSAATGAGRAGPARRHASLSRIAPPACGIVGGHGDYARPRARRWWRAS